MSSTSAKALGGLVWRDGNGVWRHTDTGLPVPGSRDMTLSWLYGDLVVAGGHVLVPDQLVRENADMAWVRQAAVRFVHDELDAEHARGGPRTPGWTDVWLVPLDEWDRRNREVLGMVVDGWTRGPLPR